MSLHEGDPQAVGCQSQGRDGAVYPATHHQRIKYPSVQGFERLDAPILWPFHGSVVVD